MKVSKYIEGKFVGNFGIRKVRFRLVEKLLLELKKNLEEEIKS